VVGLINYTMNVYGGPPMGLDWYRLLSIYSTLGNNSKSHEKLCDIGKELAKLDGKHDAAIAGINAKLDSLIAAGTNRLSPADLSELKQTIVDGLAGHVSQNAGQCADPVVCDGESVLFTPDVRKILASLVEQKAVAMQHDGIPSIARDINRINTRLDEGVPWTGADADKLGDWFEYIEEQGDKLAALVAAGFSGAADRHDLLKTTLAEAVVAKMGTVDAPSTQAFTDALGAFFDNRDSLSEGDTRVLAEAVFEKMRSTDNTDRQENPVYQKFIEILAKVREEGVQIPEPTIQRILDAVDRPPDFDEELYLMNIRDVLQLFDNKDKRLIVTKGLEQLKNIDNYVRNKRIYSHNQGTLNVDLVVKHVESRGHTLDDTMNTRIQKLLQNFHNDVNSLRMLHSILANDTSKGWLSSFF